ncbi:GerAB/ArcD/ProY family transporter [Niallia endozanthoxylica]|uniref:GerAB/ArcD/ProY family transporter n=1 Tax=Niallia endozanthoxylica TaxID=2036016 RepID=A0A5J5I3T0_9BACI|nr:GerAB/ArcD/ProY family transporter [Niallia endozanthoxylica]KAA9031134.1 GerAB/ArcD/ProY family transporter [Niallia endozanthoxylica]
MKQQQGKLGIREYTSIAVLMVGTKATENTPAALYNAVQSAAWMIPLISAGLFLIPLFLLLKTFSLFQGKDLFAIVQRLLGKYIGFFVLLSIFIISSFAFSFDSRMASDIIHSFYFRTTPLVVLYAIFIFVCVYGAKKGIQHIGSISYIMVWYIIFSFVLAMILSIMDGNIQAIYPILGSGIQDITKSSISGTTLFADLFILTAIISNMSSTKDFTKGTWIAFILNTIHLSAAIFIFIFLFDRSLAGLGYPFHTAIRYFSFGKFLTNVETLFLPIWLMATFIRFAALLYICTKIFAHIFRIKEADYLIPALATIYWLTGMIPETPLDVGLLFKAKVRLIAGPTFAALSLLLWIVALLKGEFNHATNKKGM